MPVKELTPEEVREWLAGGLVLFGQKPPPGWRKDPQPAAPPASPEPPTDEWDSESGT